MLFVEYCLKVICCLVRESQTVEPSVKQDDLGFAGEDSNYTPTHTVIQGKLEAQGVLRTSSQADPEKISVKSRKALDITLPLPNCKAVWVFQLLFLHYRYDNTVMHTTEKNINEVCVQQTSKFKIHKTKSHSKNSGFIVSFKIKIKSEK